MLKEESAAIYAAYTELERAAEVFYTAADRLAALVPGLAFTLNEACEELNFAVVAADTELDEVL